MNILTQIDQKRVGEMVRMDRRRTKHNELDERLACATKLLSEAKSILEAADYDVAAAYVQMAADQCDKPLSPAKSARMIARNAENC